MKYQILSIPRTGSSYVRRVIRLHTCMGIEQCNINEPFSNENFETLSDKDGYSASLNDTIAKNENIVVKNHYYQLALLKEKFPSIYNAYLNNAFFNIQLLRKDFFESALSNAIAKKTRIWGDDTPPATHADITQENLLESMRWYRRLWEMAAHNPLNLTVNTTIYYEELSFIPHIDFQLITGNIVEKIADSVTTPSKNKKLVVDNYNELKELSLTFLNSFSHPGIIQDNGYLTLKCTNTMK